MTFDKPIKIQVQDPVTEEWTDAFEKNLLAKVNKTGGGSDFNAGAEQYHVRLTFELRYLKKLEEIAFGVQPFRIIYRGKMFKIVEYDDFKQLHRTIKLDGVLYG